MIHFADATRESVFTHANRLHGSERLDMTATLFLIFTAFGMALAALAVSLSGVAGFAAAGAVVTASAAALTRSRGDA